MFRRRLSISFAVLAVLAVLQSLGLALVLEQANDHVRRGRVASDIQVGFLELSVVKQRLRSWVLRAQLNARPDAVQRDQLLAAFSQTLARLEQLTERAVTLDESEGREADDHGRRREALVALRGSFGRLQSSLEQVEPLAPSVDTERAWQSVARMFDAPEGLDLRQLTSDSIAREALAVPHERAAADVALRRMRLLGYGAAAVLAVVAAGLAAYFSRALREPLERLTQAARALQRGELEHRLSERSADEFATVARSVNAMAKELAAHREREQRERSRLEDLVSERTKELGDALATLQKVDARRRQLFADISHELRTPTTAIRGEAEITLRGENKSTSEYKDALQRIVDTTRQLAAVIDDVLTMARSDIDALALDRQRIDLREPLADAIATARALASVHAVTIEDALIPSGRFEVLGDGQRLRQLFMLVLDNAVRYSRSGGCVRVEARQVGSRCELTIVDQGIGIRAEELAEVFQRNFRGDAARRHRADGTGLGLSIAAALLRAHNGDIAIASQPEQGTTVTIHLPLLTPGLGSPHDA